MSAVPRRLPLYAPPATYGECIHGVRDTMDEEITNALKGVDIASMDDECRARFSRLLLIIASRHVLSLTGSRVDRMSGRKQCQAYACPHNTLVTLDDNMPGRRYDGRAPEWSLDGESASATSPSCALDVSATGPKTCRDLERMFGRHRRRWQQEVHAAVVKWIAACRRRDVDTADLERMISDVLATEG